MERVELCAFHIRAHVSFERTIDEADETDEDKTETFLKACAEPDPTLDDLYAYLKAEDRAEEFAQIFCDDEKAENVSLERSAGSGTLVLCFDIQSECWTSAKALHDHIADLEDKELVVYEYPSVVDPNILIGRLSVGEVEVTPISVWKKARQALVLGNKKPMKELCEAYYEFPEYDDTVTRYLTIINPEFGLDEVFEDAEPNEILPTAKYLLEFVKDNFSEYEDRENSVYEMACLYAMKNLEEQLFGMCLDTKDKEAIEWVLSKVKIPTYLKKRGYRLVKVE